MEQRWINVNGRAMYTRVFASAPADAPVVVLVHGLIIAGDYMLPTAKLLAAHYRVYVPDLPGFGRSEKPPHTLDTTQLADALAAWYSAVGIAKAAWVGNSYGCQVIAALAVRYPALVERAVLQGLTIDQYAHSYTEQIIHWLCDAPNVPLSQFLLIGRDFVRCGLVRALDTVRTMFADYIETSLPHIHAPTLVVRGSRDPVAPQRWAEQAARLLPYGQLVVIPGAGHTLNHSAPLEFVGVLRPFLDGR